MKEEQINERIYDLVEKFDFNDLSEEDKKFVLLHISKEEYDRLRLTIHDTQQLFAKYPYQENRVDKSNFRKIATYPVELYKIAAVILLILGVGFVFTLKISKQSPILAMVDTIVVKKTDTVFIEVKDTVVRIKEKIVDRRTDITEKTKHHASLTPGNAGSDWDCSRELCPADIRNLSAVKGNNSISKDSSLTEFIVFFN